MVDGGGARKPRFPLRARRSGHDADDERQGQRPGCVPRQAADAGRSQEAHRRQAVLNSKSSDVVSNRVMTRLACLFLAMAALSGCAGSASSSQDVSKLLAVTEVKTGWFDAGLENGKNKLVPMLTITLKNVSQQNVALVQLNAVIRRVGEDEEWGGAYTRAIGSPGLAPGQSTPPIVLRSNLGYT